MDYSYESKRLPYYGWEVRSRLTRTSIEGTVAAGAEIFVEDVCKCHIISSEQFAEAKDALDAIERKARHWINGREVEPTKLRHDPGLRTAQSVPKEARDK
jgi:hypothetical protein